MNFVSVDDVSYCDTTFDKQLSNIEGVNRLPWIGLNYNNQKVKTLLLGESVYDWKPKDPSNFEKIYHSDSLRKIHKSHALNFKKNSKFVRNIERALFIKKYPTDDEKSLLWNSVVYHNLVSKVLKTKKKRPAYSDYYYGWHVFGSLVSILDIDQVLVYGLENSKIKSFLQYCDEKNFTIIEKIKIKDKVGRSYPRKITFQIHGKNISMLFIRHPSSYFSWKKWGSVIRSTINVPDNIA
ncbi:hypothetical protein [Marinospirillum sp.]|uniref:hypothetical protein n=1 Tax=Marinospirillum sp. TaxID=2183934 RepID=UPI00384ED3B7